MEISLYSAGIAIILASIYALRFIRIEYYINKVAFQIPTWFGGGSGKLGVQDDEPDVTREGEPLSTQYTSSWWKDEKQFQLERRAIFSQSWLFVTHASRFQKPGDYRTFEIVGFSFIVILGKDKRICAFHNICRHRAYAVTKKESGSSTVLGCRYHGWSYDTKGKLIKAPEFENVAGFDKTMNGLWELKTEVRNSMVYVKFGPENDDSALDLTGFELDLKKWKINEMKLAHEWKMEGAFNWKLAAGTFFSRVSAKNDLSFLKSIRPAVFQRQTTSWLVSHNTIFRQLSSGRVLIVRLLPLSASKTLMECNIYGLYLRHSRTTQSEMESIKMEVESEAKRLEFQQEGLLGGRIQFHNSKQDELKEILGRHSDVERRLGKEIHPAARTQNFTKEGIADDDLCKGLETSFNDRAGFCGANSKGLLDW